MKPIPYNKFVDIDRALEDIRRGARAYIESGSDVPCHIWLKTKEGKVDIKWTKWQNFTFWFLQRVIFPIVVYTSIYKWWSYFYRFLWERSFKKYPLKLYNAVSDVVVDLENLKWTPDGWRELWDAVEEPGYVQWIIDGKGSRQPNHGTDCDAFAIWLTNIWKLNTGKLSSYFSPNAQVQPNMMSIFWQIPDTGGFEGHNVCFLTVQNDEGTQYYYQDYTYPYGPFKNKDEAVNFIITKFRAYGRLVGCVIYQSDLTITEHFYGN